MTISLVAQYTRTNLTGITEVVEHKKLIKVIVVSANNCAIQFKQLSATTPIKIDLEYSDLTKWMISKYKAQDLITPSSNCDSIRWSLHQNIAGQWVPITNLDATMADQAAHLDLTQPTLGPLIKINSSRLRIGHYKLVAASNSATTTAEQLIDISIKCDFETMKEMSTVPLKISAETFSGDSTNNLLALQQPV